jgi:hypothetical protein
MQLFSLLHRDDETVVTTSESRPNIFGLRYLEEEAAEIHDVIGCLRSLGTTTSCDDEDQLA